jgi:hypothetical protein
VLSAPREALKNGETAMTPKMRRISCEIKRKRQPSNNKWARGNILISARSLFAASPHHPTSERHGFRTQSERNDLNDVLWHDKHEPGGSIPVRSDELLAFSHLVFEKLFPAACSSSRNFPSLKHSSTDE